MPYLETRIRHLRYAAEKNEGESLNRYNTVRLRPPPEDKLRELDHGPGAYRYKFKPAPPQYDQVIRHIKLAIRELNIEYICFANMNFRVVPTDSSPPFWPPYPGFPTYFSKLYTIMDDYNEFPLTAWVTFYPREAGLTTNTIYAKIGSEWVSLKQWLLSKQTPSEDLVGMKGFKAQRKWWRLNGKKFRLMSLPAELRSVIYEHALGPRLYPLSTVHHDSWYDSRARYEAAVNWGLGFYNASDGDGHRTYVGWLDSGLPPTTADYSICRPNLALLQISKQVNQEACQVGWENTRKCFISPRQLTSVFEASRVPKYNWLNKVILDFSMRDWFEFFGVNTYPHFHMDTLSSLGYLLRALPTLVHLQMWFRSPDDGHMFSPWSSYNITTRYTCCQRVMVNWIMTFAWPFIKDLPKVIIGGAVKKDSKKYWDGLLSLSTKDKDTIIDYLAEEAAIFNTDPMLLPPPCVCRTSCSVDHGTRRGEEYRKKDHFDYEDDC